MIGRAAASAQGPGARETSLAPVLALLEGCSPHGLVELERVLAARLRVETTAAQERVAALFALAELLRSPLATRLPRHPIAKTQIERLVYDELRPEGAPSSETLVRRFGSADHGGWLWALRAADGLLPDGRKRGEGQTWPHPSRGRWREPDTTPEEIVRSIRACALALGRRPTSAIYLEWVRRKRRRARGSGGGGSGPRLCGWPSVRRHFGGWRAALATAEITDEELAAARAARAGSVGGQVPPGEKTPAGERRFWPGDLEG